LSYNVQDEKTPSATTRAAAAAATAAACGHRVGWRERRGCGLHVGAADCVQLAVIPQMLSPLALQHPPTLARGHEKSSPTTDPKKSGVSCEWHAANRYECEKGTGG
jgi:hypothetical protein